MKYAEASVATLVKEIEAGEIRLPEMQRQYVWKGPRVRDLLDSLYRGYPSGAILLWETNMDVPERSFSVGQEKSPYKMCKLLLDGQQRLTSLSSVLRGEPITVRNRKRPIDILFNLEHPENLTIVTEVDENADTDKDIGEDSSESEIEKRFNQMAFVLSTKKLANKPHWVSVTEVFKTDSNESFIEKAGIESYKDPLFKKYNARLSRLRDIKKYMYRLVILEPSLSYEEVTEIFVRVNSLGAKLRGSDLALAQITAKWRDSLKLLTSFQEEFAKSGFDNEIGTYVRTLVCFATDQSRFLKVNSILTPALEKSWIQSVKGLEFAKNYLVSNIGIDSSALLSSPYFLIILAYFGAKNDFNFTHEQRIKLRTWLLAANAKGRYSRGSSETMLDQDLNAINKAKGIDSMLDNLRQQFGRIEFEKGDLVGRSQRSGLFKTMFLAFKQDGAMDWRDSLIISLKHSGNSHKLQFHHIFPKAYLKNDYENKEVNDLANLSFIGGKTNRKISDKAPSIYFPDIIKKQGKEAFIKQCVPTDIELLDKEEYENFLDKRRELIVDRLNRFILEK